jgi:alpha-N-arabinofuranosidase
MIFMANYAQTVNVIGCIKTNTTSSVFDATGQALKLYRKVFGTVPVAVTGETRPLDIAATLNEAIDSLTVSIINPTWDEISLPVEILDGSFAGNGQLWQITAPDVMAFNEPGRPENVKIEGPEAVSTAKTLKIKPASISIYVFPVKKYDK